MKNVKYLVLFVMSALLFTQCKDDIKGTNDLDYISFEPNIPLIVVEQGGSKQVDVHAYTTQKTGADRTYNVEVIEAQTTADAQSYSIPSTVVVPANSNVATIPVTIQDNANLSLQTETIGLRLTSADGGYFGNAAEISIQKFCPWDINDLAGIYTYQSGMFEDSWDVEVQVFDANTLLVKDMIEMGRDAKIILDNSDPFNVHAIFEKQEVWMHSSYGIASFAGEGSFLPCTSTIELSLELTVSAGSFGTANEILTKQ